MQYFASQLREGQERSQTLRASQYRKKRKSGQDVDEDEDDETGSVRDVKSKSRRNSRSTSRASSFTPYYSAEHSQLQLAGLLPDDEDQVPPAPFPHAPAKPPGDRHRPSDIQEALANASPRLFNVNAATRDLAGGQSASSAWRKTHLNILSTILHQCLLQRDYRRAGRAWGMILRTQVQGGQTIDPRNHGRWGIGAEILLHEYSQDGVFSAEGFERAREYYERLIVQFPYRKTHPHAIDDRSFYPAMFSLWIYELSELSKRAKQAAESEESVESHPVLFANHLELSAERLRTKLDKIRLDELAGAKEIIERVDQLISSPPFDKDTDLLELRGNLSLWLGDLQLIDAASEENEPSEMDIDSEAEAEASRSERREERLEGILTCHKEFTKARRFFERASANGAIGQDKVLAKVNVKQRELAIRFGDLCGRRFQDYEGITVEQYMEQIVGSVRRG